MEGLSKFASRLEAPIYTLLRIVAGAMFAVHGTQKLFGWFGAGFRPPVLSQLWIGGVIELCGGTLIALGLFTRAAAFLCAGTMAVAYIQFHWKLRMTGALWLPQVNKGELAVLYCWLFLFIMARGPGAGALDGFRKRRR
jgi:putative oxidoreductase